MLAACDAAAGIEAGAELRVNGNAPALRDDRLLDVDVRLLATSLAKGGHPFAALDASYNRLGGECADALKELLRTDSRLQALDLSYSDLGGAAAESCARGCARTRRCASSASRATRSARAAGWPSPRCSR